MFGRIASSKRSEKLLKLLLVGGMELEISGLDLQIWLTPNWTSEQNQHFLPYLKHGGEQERNLLALQLKPLSHLVLL